MMVSFRIVKKTAVKGVCEASYIFWLAVLKTDRNTAQPVGKIKLPNV